MRRSSRASRAAVPLVVVLEDVHWAEPTLLDLVEYLGRGPVETPLLLLCLARPELPDERPGLGAEARCYDSSLSRALRSTCSCGGSAA